MSAGSGCTGAILFIAAALAAGTGCGSNNDQGRNVSNLDGLEDRDNDGEPDVNAGKDDGTMDPGDRGDGQDPNAGMDPGTGEEPCNDPPIFSKCEELGNICLPFDQMSARECPEGLELQPFECPSDPSGEPLFCCGFTTEPGPEPDPYLCESYGGFCAPVDEMNGVFCPEGTEPLFEIPCTIDWENGVQSVCCGFRQEPPPPPPANKCEELGNICVWVDPMTGWAECPEGLQPLQWECPYDEWSGTFSICCGRGEDPYPQPEPTVCPDPNDPDVFYVSEDPAVCDSISYTCPSNHVVFESDCGCGCIAY